MRFIFLGIIGVLRLASAIFIPTRDYSPQVRYIFSFGDSYTSDSHTLNFTEVPRPSLLCPVGPLEGCIGPSRSNNGSQGNWILDLTTEFNRSGTVLFNYAQDGAVVDITLFFNGSINDGIKQLQYPSFKATAANVPNGWANWTSSDALASFFIGINDVGLSYTKANKTGFIETVMDQYFDMIQNLYDIGIRDFLFLNLPPTWRTPLYIASGSNIQTEIQQSVEIYNAQLHERIGLFQETYNAARTYEFNTTAFFTDVLDDPFAYNFTSPLTTWCNNSTCFWVNDYHPTSWAHKLMAIEVAKFLSQCGFW